MTHRPSLPRSEPQKPRIFESPDLLFGGFSFSPAISPTTRAEVCLFEEVVRREGAGSQTEFSFSQQEFCYYSPNYFIPCNGKVTSVHVERIHGRLFRFLQQLIQRINHNVVFSDRVHQF